MTPRDLLNPPYPDHPEIEPGARQFGATIRARRIAAGFSLRRLCERMNMHLTDFSYIEQGRRLMSSSERASFERVMREGR